MMRGLGGIPVDRREPGRGVVEEMAERFKNEKELLLALSPEGTQEFSKSMEDWISPDSPGCGRSDHGGCPGLRAAQGSLWAARHAFRRSQS